MKKSLAIALVSLFMVAGSASMAANNSSDNKVVAGCKKVGTAIVWPFKKLGQGMKAVGHKISGK
jgi:hypothetical protein